jgi:hypothetical protein
VTARPSARSGPAHGPRGQVLVRAPTAATLLVYEGDPCPLPAAFMDPRDWDEVTGPEGEDEPARGRGDQERWGEEG